jgi:hypothetical protein
MNPQFSILIRQQNYGWSCSQPSGADRVFALKEQAVQFAQLQCTFAGAEIRICDRFGSEERLQFGPGRQPAMTSQAVGSVGDAERSIISFAAAPFNS